MVLATIATREGAAEVRPGRRWFVLTSGHINGERTSHVHPRSAAVV